jgi:two-component system, LuxR family, response regulator FixJ
MTTEPLICVVDDDDSVRDSLRELLESSGYAVEDYNSAIRFLASDAVTRCQCLIADVRMPEMDGMALQRELTRRGHRLPIIVVTGHGDIPLAVRALKAGAADFLEKPFNDEALLAGIRSAIEIAEAAPKAGADAAVVAARMNALTEREREVLELLVLGHANKVVAQKLTISFRTVEIHRARVLSKMEARSIAELVRLVLTVRPDSAG